MGRFHEFVLAWPRAVAAAILLGWLALLGGLTRLQIATDGHALVPVEAMEVMTARDIDKEFGVGDELVLVVSSRVERGIWDQATLHRLVDLSRELASVEGVDAASIQSIATERGDHVRPGSLKSLPWFEPWPATDADLDSLRTRIERIALYRGTLIAAGSPARSASIVFRLDKSADRRSTIARILSWLESGTGRESDTYLVGAALAESRLGDHLLADLAFLVPGALLLMGIVLFVRFRSVWAALLPLAGVGLVLTTTFALMGLCGARVYLTLLVLPVVLTVVGVADAIHLLDDYFERVRANPSSPRRELLKQTLARQWKPILAAEWTTAIGFVSFAFSPLPPVRVFGTFATLGVGLYTLWSLVGLPALLVLLDKRGLVTGRGQRSHAGRQRLGEHCRAVAMMSQRRPRVVIAVLLVTVALCIHGISLLRVEDSWLSGFARSSATYRDTQRFEAEFTGVHTLRMRISADAASARGRIERSDVQGGSVRIPDRMQVEEAQLRHDRLRLVPVAGPTTVSTAQPYDFLVTGVQSVENGTRLLVRSENLPNTPIQDLLPRDVAQFDFELSATQRFQAPELLALVGELESFLADQHEIGVGRVIGPLGHFHSLETMLRTSAEVGVRRVQTRAGIAEALDLYDLGRGKDRRTEFWNAGGDHLLITALVRDASYVGVGELMRRVRDFEQRKLAPHGLTIAFGGDLARSQVMIDGIVRTQIGSLLGSVLGNAVVIALALLSLRLGLISGIPCALAVAGNFALMGWTGVPLGVATSLFAAMTIGVGVDWAIHLVRAVRAHMAPGLDIESATRAAFADVGPAVVIDATCVGLGFSPMLLSSVPPTRHLGLVLVASLFTCLLATLVFLPALLVIGRRSNKNNSV